MSFLHDMKPRPGVIAIVIYNSTDYKYSNNINNSNIWNRKQYHSNMKRCNNNLTITLQKSHQNSISLCCYV